jgi:hypothetical protein
MWNSGGALAGDATERGIQGPESAGIAIIQKLGAPRKVSTNIWPVFAYPWAFCSLCGPVCRGDRSVIGGSTLHGAEVDVLTFGPGDALGLARRKVAQIVAGQRRGEGGSPPSPSGCLSIQGRSRGGRVADPTFEFGSRKWMFFTSLA